MLKVDQEKIAFFTPDGKKKTFISKSYIIDRNLIRTFNIIIYYVFPVMLC